MSFLDNTGLAHLVEKFLTLLSGKVDKVEGKGLSANDFTAAYKTKLDGIATGANKYTLPVAGDSLGGVKTTSTVTSASGYTPTPIIDGVPYYKDTNTTYNNAGLGQGYGTCATAEATAAKAVTLSGYTLTLGGIVAVKFTYGVPASATMNINSKGAKAIFYKGAAITAGIIKAGDTVTFIYDGTQYHVISIDRDNNTTYSNMGAATASAAGSAGLVPAPAAGAQAKFLRADGTWQTPANTTYAAITTEEIDALFETE